MMEDMFARSLALAHSAIITSLLQTLIETNRLSPRDVQMLLMRAGLALEAKQTDASVGAMGIVAAIGEEVGVSPSQIGFQTN